MKTQLNTSADPCTNFYEYACGGRDASTVYKGPYNIDAEVDFAIEFDALDHLINDKSLPSSLQPVTDMITKCSKSEDVFIDMVKLVDDFGGFTIFGGKMKESLSQLSGTLAKSGFSLFFDAGLTPNVCSGSKKHTLGITQPSLNFGPSELYTAESSQKYMDTYALILGGVAAVKGMNSTDTKAAIAATSVTINQLEYDLAKIHEPIKDTSKVYTQFNPYRWKNLDDSLRFVNLTAFLPENNVESDNPCILTGTPRYLKKVDEVLSKYNASDIQNYAMMRIMFQFFSLGLNANKKPQGYLDCLRNTYEVAPFIVGRYFKQRQDPGTFEGDVMDSIGKVFAIEWNSAGAKEKIDGINFHTLQPDPYDDDDEFNNRLASLEINANASWIENLVALKKWGANNIYSMVGKSLDEKATGDFTSAGTEVSYDYQTNSLSVPSGLLSEPYYYPIGPNYVNFATAGFKFSRAMAKAVSSYGYRFDAKGGLEDTFSESYKKRVDGQLELFANHYSKYCENGVCLDGAMQANENWADVMGLNVAFKAYKQYVQRVGEEPRLPGMENLSPLQQFFISYAKNFCGRQDFDENYNKVQTMSPSQIRLEGSLLFVYDFKGVFGCNNTMTSVFGF